MKMQSLLCATALIGISLFTSCNKATDALGGGGSGNLPVGKGTITFNSSTNFGGGTTYNGTNTTFSFATRQASTAYDQITIQTIEYAGTSAKTAQFVILVKKGLVTTGSSLNANFANTASDEIYPVLVVANSANTADAYASETGTVTITKLSTTEVEGTFSGHFVNDDQNTSIEVTNGQFAGKFQ